MRSFASLFIGLIGLIGLWLGACMGSGTSPTDPDPATALSYDAHFVALFAPYATPEDCLATEPQPFSCILSLSLCKSGRAGHRLGDIVRDGAYDMVGAVAHASFTDGSSLQFDVDAVAELGAAGIHWIVDTQRRWETLQFDNIDCDRP